MPTTTRLFSTLAIATALTVSTAAEAQPAGRPDPYAGLHALDREALVAAIDAIGADKSPRAISALRDRIEEGLAPEVLDHAVDTLVAIGRGPAARVLADLARHRRAEVRQKVAEAIVSVRAPNARQVLVGMLDDPSASVRTAAAHALGELGARPAMRELIVASTRGLGEATTIVGAQATPADIARILREVVDPPTLDTHTPLLRAFAKRADLPMRTRQGVIERLIELATPGCHALLEQIIADVPESDALHQPAVEALGELRQREEEGDGGEREAGAAAPASPTSAQPSSAAPAAPTPREASR